MNVFGSPTCPGLHYTNFCATCLVVVGLGYGPETLFAVPGGVGRGSRRIKITNDLEGVLENLSGKIYWLLPKLANGICLC